MQLPAEGSLSGLSGVTVTRRSAFGEATFADYLSLFEIHDDHCAFSALCYKDGVAMVPVR